MSLHPKPVIQYEQTTSYDNHEGISNRRSTALTLCYVKGILHRLDLVAGLIISFLRGYSCVLEENQHDVD